MQIKLYNKSLTPLTTLFQSELESVSFTNSLFSSGSATFLLRADNIKLNPTVLTVFNRVKIFEGSVCVFYGFITQNEYTLDTVQVNCLDIAQILQNRTAGGSFAASGSMANSIGLLLTQVNSLESTGITLGQVTGIAGTYTQTWNSGESVKDILDNLLEGYQYYIDQDGKLNANLILGNDLSKQTVFRYDTKQLQIANLATFKVTESSSDLLSKITALNDNVYPVQTLTSSSLIAKHGIVETTKKYYKVYSPAEITAKATADLKGASYTPELTLLPSIKDSFSVTDFVGIRLFNNLIDISASYQIIEKSVTFIGGDKRISVKLNDKQRNLLDLLLEQKKKVKLLENN